MYIYMQSKAANFTDFTQLAEEKRVNLSFGQMKETQIPEQQAFCTLFVKI